MDGQSLGLVILGVVAVLPFIFVMINKVRDFSYEIFLFKGLSIRAIDRVSHRGTSHVVIKMAFAGKEDIIVDEVVVQSKLTYPRRFGGVLAWLQLGIGYVLDDVEGLDTVLGRSSPYIGLLAVPSHRIKNAYIRKPLNAIWGMLILFYFIIYLFPLFWPVLYWGPYQELRLFSRDEKVVLSKKDSKVQLKRPFILKPGFEKCLTISYGPSSLYYTFFRSKVLVKNAKISYVKEPAKLRGIKLPRNDEFTWKATDILQVKLCGKVIRYPVKLGVSYANIHL